MILVFSRTSPACGEGSGRSRSAEASGFGDVESFHLVDGRKTGYHVLNLFRADVEMRRHSNPTLARGREYVLGLQRADDRAAVHLRMPEADNSRAASARPANQDLVASVASAVFHLLRQGIHRSRDIRHADFQKKIERRLQAIAPNGV